MLSHESLKREIQPYLRGTMSATLGRHFQSTMEDSYPTHSSTNQQCVFQGQQRREHAVGDRALLGQHLPEESEELRDFRRSALGRSFGAGEYNNWAVRNSSLEDSAEGQTEQHVGLEGESHSTRITVGKEGNS